MPFDWAPYYSGSGKYKITFDINIENSGIDGIILDLGDLRYMATAWLNNKNIGDFWCVPFQTIIPANQIKSSNTLKIEVKNLDANRIIQMDKDGIQWKNFYEINFVDIRYEPFDASEWDPMPSGLLGPVRIIPYLSD